MAQPVSPVLKDGIRHANEELFDLGEKLLPVPVLQLSVRGSQESPTPGIGISRWKFTPTELAEVIKSNGEFYVVYCGGIVTPLRVIGTPPKLDAKNGVIDFEIKDETSALVGADIVGLEGENGACERDRGGDSEPGVGRVDR